MAKAVNEVRRDIFGRQVVISAMRAARPHDAPKPRVEKVTPKEKCFFCPGNEHLTPPEIDRVEKDGAWEVRVFPNKFPAFSRESKKAYGLHEVVVETPDHQKTLSELSVENLSDYLSVLAKRVDAAYSDPKIAYASVFKNEGQAAGASLEHSHTQIAGMGFVPKFVSRLAKSNAKFRKIAEKKRNLVLENDSFVVVCPHASRFQHEMWILPKNPVDSLVGMDSAQIANLASALKSSLAALDALSGYRPYNLVFHCAPKGVLDFPFHVEILPRHALWAGFELGTEIVMLSTIPAESAHILKEKIEK